MSKKEYTKDQILDLLVAMDMGINPEEYPSCEGLTSIDFMDLPYSRALKLGLELEFEEESKKEKNK